MSSGMLFFRLRVVLLTVLVLVGCTVAFAQDNPAGPLPADDGAAMADPVLEIWRGMLDAGMIDETQYQHVLQHGRLPGGSIVQNSPVEPAMQSVWQGLAAQEIITPEELAHMLFKGAVPNLTEAETKAFEELAPVYEPDRSKRLTYDVRRKHQRVELIRLKHRSRIEWQESHSAATNWAAEVGQPLRWSAPDGSVIELVRLGAHGEPVFNVTCNANAARTISTDIIQLGGSSPFDLTGANVTAAMWDGGGSQTNHVEIQARVFNLDDASPSEHPTGVAGTLAASGVSYDARGMAFQGNIHVYDWNYLIPEMTACVASNDSIRISNHSYGLVAGWFRGWLGYYSPMWNGDAALSETEDWRFGYYTGESRAMDEFVYTAPYHLPVYACGNDRGEDVTNPNFLYGYRDSSQGSGWYYAYYYNLPRPVDGGVDGFDCIQPRGVSKNILTVGAVQDLPGGYSNGVQVVIEPYSGHGPADDGRIKPDIVANGQSVFTTYTTSTNGYAAVSGTSFASPSAAGTLMLLQELHERIYGPDRPMLASTVKALAIHSADDIGDAPGPDYRFGWGLMNAESAAWIVTNNACWNSLPHIKEVSLRDGDFVEFGALASTGTALKVTICWTDPPGTVPPYVCNPTNIMLVNDLDLRVFSPDGGTNFPWVLDHQNPTNAAMTGDNYRDNVEQVVIPDPISGWFTVRVTHKGTLSNGVQDVSIVVTGNTPEEAPDFYITDIGLVNSNGLVQIEWPGVVGALYQVNTTTNLMIQGGWTNLPSAISANREGMTWIDENSSHDEIRFYRMERLR